MNYRFYADFVGADPRFRDVPKPAPQDCDCPSDSGAPAWEAEPEPLRSDK